MDERRADTLLRSLGERTRREMVRILGEAPLTVGEISEVMSLPQSTVSRHLKTLRSTGLLVDRREANRVYVGLVDPRSNGRGQLDDLLNEWIRQQDLPAALRDRLDRVLAERGGEDAFERLAHQWDDLRFQHFGGLFHLEALASLLPRNWTVLDIGTGTGYFLPFLSRQFEKVVAVEPSEAMLGLARERAGREGLDNVDIRPGRLEELPAADASIDAALVILTLHHSSDRPRALRELRRTLKEGGKLLLVDLFPHELRDFQRAMGDPSRGIDPEALVPQLEEIGFRTENPRALPRPPADHPSAPRRPAPELFRITAQKAA